MTVTLPIYIEEHSRGAGEAPLFMLRPLHRDEPLRRSEKLARALAQMQSDLQTKLLEMSQDTRHDELARWLLAHPEAIPVLRRILIPVESGE